VFYAPSAFHVASSTIATSAVPFLPARLYLCTWHAVICVYYLRILLRAPLFLRTLLPAAHISSAAAATSQRTSSAYQKSDRALICLRLH